MSESRIMALSDHYYKGTLAFDQFILGATLAVCAYLAQTNVYDRLGWNVATLQLIPLALLGVSVVLGFKRIERSIHTLKMNGAYLELCRKYQGLDFSTQLEEVQRVGDRAGRYYKLRNYFLLLGLLSFIAVKFFVQYDIF